MAEQFGQTKKTDWGYGAANQRQTCPSTYKLDNSWQISDPQNTNIIYRFNRGQSIQRSTDKGQTWSVEYDLSEISKDVRNVYHYGQHKQTTGDISIRLGPLDAKFDNETGNLVVAMGWDGVLVRPPDGKWQWITVGPYHLEILSQPQTMLPFLASNELWLALLLIPLCITTVIYSIQNVSSGMIGTLILGWSFWFISLLFPPDIRPSASVWGVGFFGIILFPLTGVYAIPFALYALKHIRGRQAFQIVASMSIVIPLLFLLPFALWTQGTIGNYRTATFFALALAGATIITTRVLLIDISDMELIPILEGKSKR